MVQRACDSQICASGCTHVLTIMCTHPLIIKKKYKKCSVWISKCAIKKELCMRFCGLSESMREESEREAKKQQQKSCLWLMEVVKKQQIHKKKISHCTWLFQFSLIPILRIDLSLQHCKVCAYQFFVIISLRTHSLSLTLVVCADEKMYANCCICISCISLNCIAFMQQHWQLIS